MAYFSDKVLTRRNSGQFVSDQFIPGTQGDYSNRSYKTSTVNSTVFRESRTGGNSPIPDLVRVFGIDQFNMVIAKKTIGFEFRSERVPRVIRRKDGSLLRVYKTITKKIPIKVRYARLVKKPRVATPNHGKNEFLKPNSLLYRRAYTFLAPNPIVVNWTHWNPATLPRWSGTVTVDGPGSYAGGPAPIPSVVIGDALTNPPLSVSPVPALSSIALERLYKKVQSDLPDYYTALAESPELITLIRRTLVEGLKLAKEIYRLDARRLSKRLSSKVTAHDLASLWLTWIYGVAPTLQDVADTLNVLSREERIWRSFATTEKSSIRLAHNPPTSRFEGEAYLSEIRSQTWGVILEGRLNIERYLLRATHWQTTTGLVYQVVPFSFILDWFIDVSGYLMSCNAVDSFQYYAWETSSLERVKVTSGRYVKGLDPSFYTFSSKRFDTRSSEFVVNRVPKATLPAMPKPKFKNPLTDVFSLQRSINAFALLIAGSGRGTRR